MTVKPTEMYRTSNALSELTPIKYKFKIIFSVSVVKNVISEVFI